MTEVEYMGVSQVAHGRGVGNLLMQQARLVAGNEAATLILAVGARNEPAMRLYGRWGFSEIARRAALIASACSSGR